MFAKLRAKRSDRDLSIEGPEAPLVPSQAPAPVQAKSQDHREWVKQWLLQANGDDVMKVLTVVADKRPKELKHLAAMSSSGGKKWSSCGSGEPVRIEVTPRTQTPDYGRMTTHIGEMPILQFSCGKYFCLEGEPSVEITAIRLGSIAGRSEVGYRTTEKSAIAGVNYIHTEGTLVWERGEVEKTFVVDLIDDQVWAGVVEFHVVLVQDSALNGIVPTGGAEARVQRIDDDVFPSNKYKDLILDRRVKDINPLALFQEFFKVASADPIVARGSIRLLCMGQLHNVFCILQLVANIYMVDKVLLPPEEERDVQTQTTRLFILTGLSFVPQAVMHALHYMSFSWKVVGRTRLRLASGLMNAFLYFDDAARTEVDAGALVDAMTHDTEQLIKAGYMNFLIVFQLLGRILMCVAFQLVAPIVSGSHNSQALSMTMMPMLLFPVFMVMLVAARIGQTRVALNARLQRQRSLVASVHEIVENFRLIADFGRRQWCMDQHQENVQNFGATDKAVAEVSCNNVYLMKWLTLLAVSSYVIIGGTEVINGALPTGIFLTCLRVYMQVGKLWSDIYSKFLETFNNAPALERIVDIINKHADVRSRMEWSRHQHEITRTTFQDIQRGEDLDDPAGQAIQDRIPIQIRNIGVNLCALGTSDAHVGKKVRETRMFYESMTIHQGKLVCLVGKRGMGKSTLLRILGGATLPRSEGEGGPAGGVFLIPSHLRVLHVPSEDMFIKGSLYQNLTLGVPKGHPDGCIERVREICSGLGLPAAMLDTIREEESSPTVVWSEALSGSEKHMLVIARALIANPEVMCIHKPTLHVNDPMAEKIVGMLRDFVDQRGICLPKEEKHLRRPRTCIMTSTRMTSLQRADQIFKVSALFHEDASPSPSAQRESIVAIRPDDLDKIETDDLS